MKLFLFLPLLLLVGCIPFSSSTIDELCSGNGSTLARINETWSCLPITTNLTNVSLDTRYYQQRSNYSNVSLQFNQSRQPSAKNPTFVTATVQITVDDSASSVSDDGEIFFELSSNNASWETIGSWRASIFVSVSTTTTLKQSPSMFIVPVNQSYRFRNFTYSGTPQFMIVRIKELTG